MLFVGEGPSVDFGLSGLAFSPKTCLRKGGTHRSENEKPGHGSSDDLSAHSKRRTNFQKVHLVCPLNHEIEHLLSLLLYQVWS